MYIHLHNHSKGVWNSLCSVSLLSVKIWMEGTYDMPYKNPYFFVTTKPKSDAVFAEMQIISSNFIILKHSQINSLFREILMLKVWFFFFFFFGGGGQSVQHGKIFSTLILSTQIQEAYETASQEAAHFRQVLSTSVEKEKRSSGLVAELTAVSYWHTDPGF